MCEWPKITSGVIWTLYDWLNTVISAAFQFRFMALAIDFIDRRGLSSEMCCQLLLKKPKVTLYYQFV